MKRLLSLAMSASLIAMSMGTAPAAFANAAAAARVVKAPVAVNPMIPGLASTIQSMQYSPSAVPMLLSNPGLSLHALPELQAAPAVTAAEAVPVSGIMKQAFMDAEGRPTQFAENMELLAAPAPDYKDMGHGESSHAATQDFAKRLGRQAAPAGDSSRIDDTPEAEVELLVSGAENSPYRITRDIYPNQLTGQKFNVQSAVELELQGFGIPSGTLDAYGAKAVGAVQQINTAIIRVSGGQAQALQRALESQGLKVQRGRTFTIPQNMEADPNARTIGLQEMGKVMGADGLQAELTKALGEPVPPAADLKPRSSNVLVRGIRRVAGAVKGFFYGKVFKGALLGVAAINPVLPWAILDSYAAVDHPYMKGRFIKSVSNEADGQTHGSHTASTVVGVDRWNHHGRNYNIFPNGSASEGDILIKLSMAQKDGALATTHSWGDGSGNPEGSIEKLFVKMAEAGVHHGISAGNSGYYGANTIGGPAIAYHLVDLIINGKVIGKVKRIKAVAASDADKRTAAFSSRGPGSRTTSRGDQYEDYPQKPDESGMGVNLVAAAPKGSHVDELGGPGASMSGTSMSNPGVFGGFLLLTRGILVLLKDSLPDLPAKDLTLFAMDLARYAMTQTAEKVDVADRVGDGFVNIGAAYDYAAKLLQDNAPAGVVAKFRKGMRRLFGYSK